MKKISLNYMACLVPLIALAGCDVAPVQDTTVDQFDTVRKVMDDWLGSDPPAATKADAVFDSLNDGDDSTTPFVVSVRAPEHYAIGHIPGAINIPWRTVADEGALAELPTDRKIVVYCYTGHTGGVATACINAAGFEAVNMKYGMTAWTRDTEVRAAQPFSEESGNDFMVEETENIPDTEFDLPTVNVTDSEIEADIVSASMKAYLDAGTAPVITAADLFDLLNDGDETNAPFIISVRAPDAYAIGHIPGAINIPWKTIAQEENLRSIPPNRDIVVYCYTGHSGALATTVLNVLGYNARNMKFGMVAWTGDADVRATSAFDDAVDAHDYPLEP